MNTIIKDQDIFIEEVRKLISEGHSVSITAKGYSMNPFITHMRDQITIGPYTDDDIKPGAVVLAKDNRGNYLIHRIIEREENNIRLMGDGNIGIMEEASVENVIGIMTAVIKKGRTFPVSSLRWRLYSWSWKILTPLRRYPLALWRRLHPQQPLR